MNITHFLKTMETISQNKLASEKMAIKHRYTVKTSRDLLDYMVVQKLVEWQIYNMDPSSDNYITEAKMQDAIEYIIKKIILEMTPTARDILSVGFPMETESNMIESIKNCAKLIVLNYSIKQNTIDQTPHILPNINAF